jgi:hypothetical protein
MYEQKKPVNTDQMIHLFQTLRVAFEGAAAICGAQTAALEELGNMKIAAKSGAQPITFDEVCEVAASIRSDLGATVRRAEVLAIRLGHLVLKAPDRIDYGFLQLSKSQLAKALETRFGHKFKVWIRA